MFCYTCKNFGIIKDHIVFYSFCGLYHEEFCSCRKGENLKNKWIQSEKVQEALKQKQKKEIEHYLKFSTIPKRWKEKTLEAIEIQESTKQKIHSYLDHFPKYQERGQGIYLWSYKSGTGKTSLLSAICYELIHCFSIPCIFITEKQMFRKIKDSFKEGQNAIHTFLDVKCLFIDDLGADLHNTAFKIGELTDLLDYRLNNCLPTFFTSNYNLEEYRRILKHCTNRPDRIPSRIKRMCPNFIIEV